MKAGIMQPYFLPYIGYFQLIKAVDIFILHDILKYTKKGWINRNRYLKNGNAAVFSIPLQKASDSLFISERSIAGEFNKKKLLNIVQAAYSRAPYFSSVFPLFEEIISYDCSNLFTYIHNSIAALCSYFAIETQIVVSSTVSIDHSLKSAEKVLKLCQAVGADVYINPIGGVELYDKESFFREGIVLQFLQTEHMQYVQFGSPFVPWLSILDVTMFNSRNDCIKMLDAYSFV